MDIIVQVENFHYEIKTLPRILKSINKITHSSTTLFTRNSDLMALKILQEQSQILE